MARHVRPEPDPGEPTEPLPVTAPDVPVAADRHDRVARVRDGADRGAPGDSAARAEQGYGPTRRTREERSTRGGEKDGAAHDGERDGAAHGEPDRVGDGGRRASGRRAGRRGGDRASGALRAPADHGSGHGHGHGHGPATPAGRRVKILLAALLVPCGLATLVGLVLLWPTGDVPQTTQRAQQVFPAEVVAAQTSDCSPGSGDGGCVGLTLHMSGGPQPDRELVQILPVEPSTPRFAVGDPVQVAYSGGDPTDPGSYQVVDFQRGGALLWLAAVFALAVLLLGRWRGLAALVALGMSLVVLVLFVLPAILAGSSPVLVAVVGSSVIMFVVLYLTHGFSARTSTTVIGTLLSLGLIALLSSVFSAAARLTGLDDTTAGLIATLGAPVDARGLVLAGVLIGALGVLDDVTVTQTSAVWELRAANPALGPRALFAAGMRIGRDHVSSAVNTLVLAYAGASLPLLLLFTVAGQGPGAVLTSQDVATEVVRTLVGSIGLVASVPLTTALAAIVASREQP